MQKNLAWEATVSQLRLFERVPANQYVPPHPSRAAYTSTIQGKSQRISKQQSAPGSLQKPSPPVSVWSLKIESLLIPVPSSTLSGEAHGSPVCLHFGKFFYIGE